MKKSIYICFLLQVNFDLALILMITFRIAQFQDVQAIATLHAQSWKKHYRGMLRDAYLRNEVVEDRLSVWTQRLSEPAQNQWILLAEEARQLCGFTCVYLNEHQRWGAYLDNLHVASQWQGRSLGKQLMQAAAAWVNEEVPSSGMYLWVLSQNNSAIRFYEKIGGTNYEEVIDELPGGGQGPILRFVWTDLQQLINL
ncbi:MAG: GNAT family N-acetyltransferase [Bacteroidota bacterium]